MSKLTSLISRGAKGLGPAFGLNGLSLGLAGAGAIGGAMSGDDSDNAAQRAAIGAGIGLSLATGHQLYKNYRKLDKGLGKFAKSVIKNTPGKVIMAAGVAGTGALALGTAMAPPAYESQTTASQNDMGERSYQQDYKNYSYSLSDRISSMNVSGDLVFGLHNKRHG